MSLFHDMVAADNQSVFLSTDEFGETHTIRFDGECYFDVKCVLTQLKQQERTTTMRDHAQGIYLVTAILHCAQESLNGRIPEQGTRIYFGERPHIKSYYVAGSGCDMGMIRLELEAYDE